MTALADLYAQYLMPTYGRFDVDLVRGAGCRVWDSDGKEYLDFGAGIAVCSLGHSHPEVARAVCRQAETLVHVSNLYRTEPQAELARSLVESTGAGKVFFCNSGAEANEGLIKLARKFGHGSGRHEILTMTNSFHGRTMACLSATGQEKVKTGFAPLLEGFSHVPYGEVEAVRSAVGEKTVAVLLEPIQGEGGVHIASAQYLRDLRRFCDEKGLLLLFDEIQCGLGRTGAWCAWKSLAPEVQPDAVSWAKGIANGFPLGAFWAANEKGLSDLLGPGSHGTTYGGNPVCCAAGRTVREIIERDGLLENAATQGTRLAEALRGIGGAKVAAVRSLGLMIGIELAADTAALDVVKSLMGRGLLTIPAGERVIRLLPPLNIGEEDGDAAMEILAAELT